MQSLEELAQMLRKLPGIGSRQAMRFARYFARLDNRDRERFINALQNTGNTMKVCEESRQLFFTPDAQTTLSPLINDPRRTNAQLMVVVKDEDIDAIESAGVYKGQYFVLGWLAPAVANGKTNLPVNELGSLIIKRSAHPDNPLSEIILALPATPEGDTTLTIITHEIESLAQKHNLKIMVTTLGRGLSSGLEIEYLDPDTFHHAFDARK